jgi:hypothetical protein
VALVGGCGRSGFGAGSYARLSATSLVTTTKLCPRGHRWWQGLAPASLAECDTLTDSPDTPTDFRDTRRIFASPCAIRCDHRSPLSLTDYRNFINGAGARRNRSAAARDWRPVREPSSCTDLTPLLHQSAGFVRTADTSDSPGFLRCDWVRSAVFGKPQLACSDHDPSRRAPMQQAAPGRTVVGYTAVLHWGGRPSFARQTERSTTG